MRLPLEQCPMNRAREGAHLLQTGMSPVFAGQGEPRETCGTGPVPFFRKYELYPGTGGRYELSPMSQFGHS
jgi:hypothetical protein